MTRPGASPEPGELLASGREADVFALGDGRVLRRYRSASAHDSADEAAVMAYAGSRGFPVPAVHAAEGTDMVMERLDGSTMAQAALAGRMSATEAAEMLADLMRRLHEVPARDGEGSIIHLDLHPDNVVLTARGPVVIDWRNARDGDADLDTALTALILAQVAIGSIAHPLGPQAGTVLERFLRMAPGEPLRMLDEALKLRAGQLTMAPDEIAMLPAAAARVRGEG
nr:phosphotransferase [uncultured Actinoplanes sp.]